jgi:hypothetical protein
MNKVRVGGVVALAAALGLVAGCMSSARPSIGPSATSGNPANGPNPPPGRAIGIDEATLSPDGTELTVRFTGGKDYDPSDGCSARYFGWAHETDGVLEVKVVDDTPPFAAPAPSCPALGYSRSVTIELDAPFTGERVRDLAGGILFVRRPDGLAELSKVPVGWTLLSEGSVAESPTGRWRQTWAAGGQPDQGSSKGKIELYQAFDGPAGVGGGDDVSHVEVSGAPATLYRYPPDPELVLVWTLGNDGMGLVVNETDFPVDQAIELAESLKLP